MHHQLSRKEMVESGILPVYEAGDYLQPVLTTYRRMDFTAMSQTALHNMIREQFTTEEPWGRKIVTNDSQHRYVDVPRDENDVNVFFADAHGLSIKATPIGVNTYASGVLTTQRNEDFQLHNNEYVYITMRLPFGAGFWPAFWLLAAFRSWPPQYADMILPEIDPMEYINKHGVNEYYTNLHTYNTAEPVKGQSILSDNSVKHTCPAEYNFTRDFHQFGCLRTEKFVYITLDHKVINRIPMFKEALMQGPWMILLNLAIGGGWPGNPNSATDFDQGLQIKDIMLGEYDFITEPTFDDTMQLPADEGNLDLLRDLDRMEANMKEKVCDTITDCFDQRRKELS